MSENERGPSANSTPSMIARLGDGSAGRARTPCLEGSMPDLVMPRRVFAGSRRMAALGHISVVGGQLVIEADLDSADADVHASMR
jgi:hypothetical protein